MPCILLVTCTSVHRCIMYYPYTYRSIHAYHGFIQDFLLGVENINFLHGIHAVNLDICMLNMLTPWVFGERFFGKTAVPLVLGSEIESGGLWHLYQHLCPKRISSIISLHDVPGSRKSL